MALSKVILSMFVVRTTTAVGVVRAGPGNCQRLRIRSGQLWLLLGLLIPLFMSGRAAAGELALEGGITAAYQVADEDRVDAEFAASADLFLTLRQAHGEWLTYIEGSTSPSAGRISAFYPTANADAGSVLNRDGNGGIQVSEFNYTFFLNDDQHLMLGLIDPSAWLDRSRIANDENLHFLNGSFVNNATIEFPDYTFGGVFRWFGSTARPELAIVVASSDGIADLPDRSYQDLLSLTSDERGVFIGAGASWLRERTSFRIGAWLRSDDHEVANSNGAMESNYGIYGVAGWQNRAQALNLRIGLANPDVSIAKQFAALAYERKGRRGLFGAGIAKVFISDSFRQARLDDALDAEVFFRIPIGHGSGHITPSLQYVANPGFDASGAAASSSAIVASVRFHWSY